MTKKFENLVEELMGGKTSKKLQRELFKEFTYKEISQDIPQELELDPPSSNIPSGGGEEKWAFFWAPTIVKYMIKNKMSVKDLVNLIK